MQLTMRNHGCLSKTYLELKNQGNINRRRLNEDLQRWTDLQPNDGLGEQDPVTYRVIADVPGGQFTPVQEVDIRKVLPTRGLEKEE